MKKTENITLFYKQEKSDKVYKASLEESDNKFIVNFAYGRRGATLKTGTKTQTAVEYDKAKKIYDKLVLSKTTKGYVPDEDNTTYIHTSDQVNTGIHCQLLNPVEEVELDNLLEDEIWCMQEKKDGRRMLIHKSDKTIAINRKGLLIGAPESIIESANVIKKSFIVDGEAIGEILYLFDLLSFDGEDLKDKPYSLRYKLLCDIDFGENIEIVKTAYSKDEKEKFFKELKDDSVEGVVFKKNNSLYQAGRPNSGGTQLKFKFYDTASLIVSKINDKRSVGMSLLEDVKEVFVGNVTISVNKNVPKEGEIIEVRYLYAYQNGSLYQPTFLMVRDDIDRSECVLGQLKYKNEQNSKILSLSTEIE